MYIFKNALKSIGRSKGRNILTGLIVLVISFSACISLSIRSASDNASEEAIADLTITAQISVDREKMMENGEDRESRKEALSGIQDLSLEELETYAEADSVSDFYYTESASFNGGSLEPMETDWSSQELETDGNSQTEGTGKPEEKNDQMSRNQGDFTVTGYSSDAAMADFVEGSSSITEGEMFAEGSGDLTCVINSELAAYNDLEVGDTIMLTDPEESTRTYTLTVCGIYEKETEGDSVSGMMGASMPGADSANQIYVSTSTLETMLSQYDENTNEETDQGIHTMLTGTYVFASVDQYKKFEDEVRQMGLSDDYTVSSPDLASYEQSLEPLKNLSRYAGYFLLVIFGIGAVILIVVHVFVIRERKYEIGVLAAIGMKKWKICLQFLTESFCITLVALLIGAAAGAISSVPVTNALLAGQSVSAQQTQQRFGREMGGQPSGKPETDLPENTDASAEKNEDVPTQPGADYISSISSAADLQVFAEMIGIGIVLTLISGCAALTFIMRYDPLRILNSRD